MSASSRCANQPAFLAIPSVCKVMKTSVRSFLLKKEVRCVPASPFALGRTPLDRRATHPPARTPPARPGRLRTACCCTAASVTMVSSTRWCNSRVSYVTCGDGCMSAQMKPGATPPSINLLRRKCRVGLAAASDSDDGTFFVDMYQPPYYTRANLPFRAAHAFHFRCWSQ
jgi:hypothetical protein